MAVVVTSVAVQDRDGARILPSHLPGACKKLRLIWVDGAYRGQLLDWVSDHCRFRLQAVLRSAHNKGFTVLPRRWVVERTFCLAQLSSSTEQRVRSTRRFFASIHLYRHDPAHGS